jgi:hypothetical protein
MVWRQPFFTHRSHPFGQGVGRDFDWKHTPGQDAYQRYFDKFTQSINQEVSHHFLSRFFQSLQFNYFTLDIDSTIMTHYGKQEGAKKGYNPNKRGRNSHHPLMAFVNGIRMVANIWLRSGNNSSANNFIGFLEDTLSRFGNKKVGLVRLDSGFCQKEIMDYLETKKLNYIIAAKFIHPIQHPIYRSDFWLQLDDGIEICDKTHQSPIRESISEESL